MKLGTKEWINLIQNGAKEFNIDVNHSKALLFSKHAQAILTWNKKTNLTAITKPDEMAVKHFIDSIIPVSMIPLNSKILDLGSGAGFPGIPLKILQPSFNVTMIDSVRKKVSFLQYVIRLLELKHIRSIHIRTEELAKHGEYQHSFDVVICRALTNLEQFIIMAMPFLKKNGIMIALKGKVLQKEIDNIYSNIKGISIKQKRYSLPVFGADRVIFKIRNHHL